MGVRSVGGTAVGHVGCAAVRRACHAGGGVPPGRRVGVVAGRNRLPARRLIRSVRPVDSAVLGSDAPAWRACTVPAGRLVGAVPSGRLGAAVPVGRLRGAVPSGGLGVVPVRLGGDSGARRRGVCVWVLHGAVVSPGGAPMVLRHVVGGSVQEVVGGGARGRDVAAVRLGCADRLGGDMPTGRLAGGMVGVRDLPAWGWAGAGERAGGLGCAGVVGVPVGGGRVLVGRARSVVTAQVRDVCGLWVEVDGGRLWVWLRVGPGLGARGYGGEGRLRGSHGREGVSVRGYGRQGLRLGGRREEPGVGGCAGEGFGGGGCGG